MKRRLVAAVLGTLLALGQGGAGAQQAADPAQLQQALSRAQGLLRQLAQQKAQLEAEVANLRVESAGLRKRATRLEATVEENEADLASREREQQRTAGRLARTETRLEQTRERLGEVVGKYRELAELQRTTRFEKEQLAAELAVTRRTLEDAQRRNRTLYDLGLELVELYDGKSAMDGLLQREPVTGLRKVEIQNVLQSYEYDMYEGLTDENVEAVRAPAGSAETAPFGDAAPAKD